MSGRVTLAGGYAFKEGVGSHERAMLAAAAEAGCAPSFEDIGTDTIRMPELMPLTGWMGAAADADRTAMARGLVALFRRLHDAGICHRDGHGGNIVLDGVQPLLIDLELSTRVDPDLPCYDLLGQASGVALPPEHRRIGLLGGVWWDSADLHVRQLWQDFGHLADVPADESGATQRTPPGYGS